MPTSVEVIDAKERKRRDITVDAVFDIETQDWDKFVAGGFLTSDGVYKECDWKHEEEFARFILNFEGTVWAHNGGGFDYKWLLDWLIDLYPDRKAIITSAGPTIIAVRIGKLRLFDSFALVKISLAEFSKGSGVEKNETGLECSCGNFCGGYCRIRRGMPRSEWDLLLAYLRADCESLLSSLERLRAFASENDIDLGATVGGSAWRNAYRTLDLPGSSLSVSDHFFARDAYFGGRVQLLRPWSAHGWEFDVNSMYPSRLANCALPVGDPTLVWGSDAKESFRMLEPGCYMANVTVPKMHLCPLPVRTGERVIYPYGSFSGTWCLPELEAAAFLGCEIDVKQALVWPAERVIFKDWIDKLFDIRLSAPGGKKGPLGTFIKYYMNSLTGKFGAKPIVQRIIVNPDEPIEEHLCRCKGKCSGECGCWEPIDDAGYIVGQKSFRIEPCAHVEWAAYLTSQARVEWLTQALSLGDGGLSMVYGDTDSLFSERELTRNIGKGLGQWSSDGEYSHFVGIAPKVYSFERAGSVKLKAKGVPLTRMKDAPESIKEATRRAERQRIISGESLYRTGVVGFKKGASNGKFFEAARGSRKVSQGYGDRLKFDGCEYTVPIEYNPALHSAEESEEDYDD